MHALDFPQVFNTEWINIVLRWIHENQIWLENGPIRIAKRIIHKWKENQRGYSSPSSIFITMMFSCPFFLQNKQVRSSFIYFFLIVRVFLWWGGCVFFLLLWIWLLWFILLVRPFSLIPFTSHQCFGFWRLENPNSYQVWFFYHQHLCEGIKRRHGVGRN